MSLDELFEAIVVTFESVHYNLNEQNNILYENKK